MKGANAAELISHPERLTTPLAQASRLDPLRPVSWDDALDRIAAAITRSQVSHGQHRGQFADALPLPVNQIEMHSYFPQAVLRWHLQLDTVPIPMSADAHRQRQRLDVGGFTLAGDETARLSALEKGPDRRPGPEHVGGVLA